MSDKIKLIITSVLKPIGFVTCIQSKRGKSLIAKNYLVYSCYIPQKSAFLVPSQLSSCTVKDGLSLIVEIRQVPSSLGSSGDQNDDQSLHMEAAN